ncbi:MAG: 23S rRNA (uracil(1939)-C(5))-methyltransferase RlmD [Vulcanimicrobiaceae bacterium]
MTTRSTAPKPPGAAVPVVGTQLELVFTDLLANGQAVGRVSGFVVFCFGPLPGERARVRIVERRRTYSVAKLVERLSTSPNRTQPFCKVFGACGGCQVQHLSYAAQLLWKRDVVQNALARIGGFTGLAVRPPLGMVQPRSYRNKVSLVVDAGPAGPRIGFYRQRSHDIVPIESCPVVLPELNDHIAGIDRARGAEATSAAFEQTRHIVARASRATRKSVVTFTTEQPSEEVLRAAPTLLRDLPGAVGIVNSFGLTSENAIMGRRYRVVIGVDEIEESLAGVRYRVSSGSFFQINVEMVDRILQFLGAGLTKPRRIVDLYCGAGTFALFFASRGCTVFGVEENEQAVVEAQENARLNGVADRTRFRIGRVEQVLASEEATNALTDAQIVFLDPPRKGSDAVTLDAIAQAGVPNVWYLSCDPATLARDCKHLAAKGYALGIVQPFDMFPHTGHVETLVTLSRTTSLDDSSMRDAFANAPLPVWGPEHEYSPSAREYPDFVVRED